MPHKGNEPKLCGRRGFKFPLPTSLTSSKRLTSLNLGFFIVKMIIIILGSKGIVGIK